MYPFQEIKRNRKEILVHTELHQWRALSCSARSRQLVQQGHPTVIRRMLSTAATVTTPIIYVVWMIIRQNTTYGSPHGRIGTSKHWKGKKVNETWHTRPGRNHMAGSWMCRNRSKSGGDTAQRGVGILTVFRGIMAIRQYRILVLVKLRGIFTHQHNADICSNTW